MIDINRKEIKEKMFQGFFGLEKEALRITEDGRFAQTPHPFPDHPHIVRDFCENQIEINTGISPTAEEAIKELEKYTKEVKETLKNLPEQEYLWAFSNPPYIGKDSDIPIARFYGEDAYKTEYREYLSERYGRYKMSLCGIHVNYSFGEELLSAAFKVSDNQDFDEFKNSLYLSLAKKLAAFGWIVTILTAASPIMDGSFIEKGVVEEDVFLGMASVRCSELGYWNQFTPVFDYSSLNAYIGSIEKYVTDGLIAYPSELYYPVRLKPPGENSLDALREKGVSHIELRMVDLNPFAEAGLDIRDLKFIQYLLIWLVSLNEEDFSAKAQVQAVQNYKNAARYDLKTVRIKESKGEYLSIADAGLLIINYMKDFYKGFGDEVDDVLAFQEEKLINPEKRYAWRIRREYGTNYAIKGLELSKV